MYLCPNCRAGQDAQLGACHLCGWQSEQVEGISVLLSLADRKDDFFREYVENYHALSLSDMQHGIVEKRYLSNQAEKMMRYYTGMPDSILEVGVGQGLLLQKLCTKYPGSKIVAIDISIPFLKHVRKTVAVECLFANAENLPFKDEFDLVVASDILEHVLNPMDFLLSVNISLKSNGTMLLRVPFEDNMLQYSRLLGSKYKFAHLRNFSRRNLLLMLDQAGFAVQRVFYDGFYAYGRRRLFRNGKAKELFDEYIKKYYPNENDVSNMPNWLGALLMRPLEIVVSAKKARLVSSMNYPV